MFSYDSTLMKFGDSPSRDIKLKGEFNQMFIHSAIIHSLGTQNKIFFFFNKYVRLKLDGGDFHFTDKKYRYIVFQLSYLVFRMT